MRQLHGRPLIEHVIRRVGPQVDTLWLSTNGARTELIRFGLPIVKDAEKQANRGPLAGIVATLGIAEASGFDRVAIFPCDAPFVPLDLVKKLARSLDATEAPGIIVETSRGLQPTFGLWSVNVRGAANAALESGRLALQSLCSELRMAVLDCRAEAAEEDEFLNVNTSSDLEKAELRGSNGSVQRPQRQ